MTQNNSIYNEYLSWTGAAGGAAASPIMPALYQSIAPTASVSAAVTSATAALPAPAAPTLPAASYPAIQDQR